MKKIRLEDHHRQHCKQLGISAPKQVTCPAETYTEELDRFRRAYPKDSEEALHIRTVGHLAAHHHHQQKRTRRTRMTLAKRIALALLALLGLLWISRAHGQTGNIRSINFRNNDNSQVGFIASPFTFKAGANCAASLTGMVLTFNCSGGGGAWGGITGTLSSQTDLQSALNAKESLANKDTNGGYVGRDGSGNASVPGSVTAAGVMIPASTSLATEVGLTIPTTQGFGNWHLYEFEDSDGTGPLHLSTKLWQGSNYNCQDYSGAGASENYFQFEHDFYDGVNLWDEWHLNHRLCDGTFTNRPLVVGMNKTLKQTYLAISGDHMTILGNSAGPNTTWPVTISLDMKAAEFQGFTFTDTRVGSAVPLVTAVDSGLGAGVAQYIYRKDTQEWCWSLNKFCISEPFGRFASGAQTQTKYQGFIAAYPSSEHVLALIPKDTTHSRVFSSQFGGVFRYGFNMTNMMIGGGVTFKGCSADLTEDGDDCPTSTQTFVIDPATGNTSFNSVDAPTFKVSGSALAFTHLASHPTTLSGYGITDALPSSTVLPANTTATAHMFFTAYTAATGVYTKAQPACGDLSDAGTNCATSTAIPAPSSTTPVIDGSGTVGIGTTYARADHVHPTDTTRAPLASPTFTGTVGGVTATMVGLGSVTNDAQTKAAIVPNAAPTAGQILAGNAGGTAYAAVSMSGDATLASTGALTLANLHNLAFSTQTAPACTSGGTTTFIGPSGSSTTEATVSKWTATEAFTISKMYIVQGGNTPASETATYTVMKATGSASGAAQTVTAAVAAAASTNNDTAHSFSVAAGNTVYVKVVCSGSTTALTPAISIGLGYK